MSCRVGRAGVILGPLRSLGLPEFKLTHSYWQKRRPWTLATCLFLWIRYAGILLTAFGVFDVRYKYLATLSANSTPQLNRPFLDPHRSGCRGVNFIGNSRHVVILQLRIYALYDASPRIGALIIGAFAVEILAVIGMFGVGSNHIEAVAEAVGNIVRCKATVLPSWLWLLWIPATRSSFGQIQCVYIFNLSYWVNDAKTSLEVLTALAIALPSVMGSRMTINVQLAQIPHTTLPSSPEISLGEILNVPSAIMDMNLVQNVLHQGGRLVFPDSGHTGYNLRTVNYRNERKVDGEICPHTSNSIW
ncbi:hypothetical protein K438DRAFT_1765638 [Mycena galopus ATCC 62051]|nr:hypothetical protein K438DRAFT_1765638 [Mycena galopus ATCC 62051]